jgi:hypothetical protein
MERWSIGVLVQASSFGNPGYSLWTSASNQIPLELGSGSAAEFRILQLLSSSSQLYAKFLLISYRADKVGQKHNASFHVAEIDHLDC